MNDNNNNNNNNNNNKQQNNNLKLIDSQKFPIHFYEYRTTIKQQIDDAQLIIKFESKLLANEMSKVLDKIGRKIYDVTEVISKNQTIQLGFDYV
jgi:hypothetical protein